MLRTLVILALACTALSAPTHDPLLTEEWEAFKEEHGKKYAHQEEENMRRTIWEQHVKYITFHNLQADRGVHSYWLGMNEYGDMHNEEFRSVMNGFRMAETERPRNLFTPDTPLEDLPTTVDWRPKGYVTPIKNQGQCGSCWSFSATGSLEGQTFKKTGTLVSLSEQNLVDCSRSEGNMGCQGGLMDQAFEYIQKNDGIDTEASYPYKGMNGKCHYDPANKGATDVGFKDIKKGSEDDLKQAVATVGPISVAIDASHSSFQLYRSGVYNPLLCSSSRLDHGVLAVGYGTDGGKDYWLVKNSWGTSWGMKGYIEMARNRRNKCGIATQASYPLV